mmetsp:Transcript_11506/g.35541  ORF Transcript_11506/g.35541 Transcript_11506/m.35541 type:complete len:346 (+) Transcript_11506:579-1616(+)
MGASRSATQRSAWKRSSPPPPPPATASASAGSSRVPTTAAVSSTRSGCDATASTVCSSTLAKSSGTPPAENAPPETRGASVKRTSSPSRERFASPSRSARSEDEPARKSTAGNSGSALPGCALCTRSRSERSPPPFLRCRSSTATASMMPLPERTTPASSACSAAAPKPSPTNSPSDARRSSVGSSRAAHACRSARGERRTRSSSARHALARSTTPGCSRHASSGGNSTFSSAALSTTAGRPPSPPPASMSARHAADTIACAARSCVSATPRTSSRVPPAWCSTPAMSQRCWRSTRASAPASVARSCSERQVPYSEASALAISGVDTRADHSPAPDATFSTDLAA